MKQLIFLTFLLISNLGFCQDLEVKDRSEKIINSEYFHNFKIEKYFVHTNKTVYFSGEKVWFKTYVVEDGSNLPFVETTNLHLNLYNETLELVHSELVYVENGTGYGQFELKKDIVPGTYYIQLDSNWNKNFDKTSLFKIEILNLKEKTTAPNNLSKQKVELPKEKNTTDFSIHRNKALETLQTISFEIRTNKTVAKKLKNKYLFAVLHRNGNFKSIVPIPVNKDITTYRIAFPKADAFNGINMISLFDEDKKIIEGKSFFIKKEGGINLEITEDSKTEDTLILSLKMFNQYAKANVSISVLPEETKLYDNHSNILSSFLISPYIKNNNYGIAELISKTLINTKKLDFITYITSYGNPFPYRNLKSSGLKFKNEIGVTLKGSINTKIEDLSNYKVMLSSNENELTELTSIDKDRTFTFDKLHLKHPTNYSLVLINEKGKMEKASFFIYNNYVNYKAKNTLDKNVVYKSKDSIIKTNPDNSNEYSSLPEYEDAEALDEILITANKKKKITELRKKLSNRGILGLGISKVYKPEDSGFGHLDILAYLQTLPSTSILYDSQGNIVFKNDRGARSFNDGVRTVAVTLDGVRLTDLSILISRKVSEIEYIVLNINGAGYGPLYPDGVVHLISKKGGSGSDIVSNIKIQNSKTVYGFNDAMPKYIKPELQFKSQNSIDGFSTIDWIPNFEVKPGAGNLLKINRRNYKNIKLIINGISEDGKLIYKVHNISISDN